MSEPPERPAVPSAPAPFDPGRVESPIRPGCGKPLAIGCGLAAVLVLAAAFFFVTRAHDILRWTVEAMRPEVERRLPEDVTAAERQRLEEAFARAAARAGSERLDPSALQRLQREFIDLATQEKPSREDLERFLGALEAFAGAGAPAEDASEPGPAPRGG